MKNEKVSKNLKSNKIVKNNFFQMQNLISAF